MRLSTNNPSAPKGEPSEIKAKIDLADLYFSPEGFNITKRARGEAPGIKQNWQNPEKGRNKLQK